MRLAVAPLLFSLMLLAACSAPPASDAREDGKPAAAGPPGIAPALAAGEWFTDRARESGIDFVHFNGMTGRFYQPEIMAPGVALFDYDNDGDLDVFLVQGRLLGAGTPLMPPPPGPLTDRLYRNDLETKSDGTRVLHFTDVTSQSGLAPRGYGMGVAAGDIDNDGWVDLYLTGFGRSQMFHNNGDGTFTDATSTSGTGDAASWSVSATFVD